MAENYEQRLTAHNYDFYEVASAFQKAIRRAEEDDALYWAAELYESGQQEYAWKRMIIMCSEDVGLGEPSCIVQIMALKQSYDYLRSWHDYGAMKLPFVHAVLCLVRSRKSRYCDHAITVYWEKMKRGITQVFKDYVFDMHTRRGKARGRGLEYFYQESCKIVNANKLSGEEQLEKEAWAMDYVGRIDRVDEPVKDASFLAVKKKADDNMPTLFG